MVEIDGITYPTEYVKKAILLYKDFEDGKLEEILIRRLKE